MFQTFGLVILFFLKNFVTSLLMSFVSNLQVLKLLPWLKRKFLPSYPFPQQYKFSPACTATCKLHSIFPAALCVFVNWILFSGIPVLLFLAPLFR